MKTRKLVFAFQNARSNSNEGAAMCCHSWWPHLSAPVGESESRRSLGFPGGLMRILLVEDHAYTRQALERFLSRSGFDVASADTLGTGLDVLQRQPFDAIISDIALPDGTGYALIGEARRRGINALAIALSGYDYPSEVQEPKLTGFDYHLKKPIDLVQLQSLLAGA
jgi:CheY-like chemotaxis protein